MAFLGGLPGILAEGTTAGLGTAEQQRARQDAAMRLGLNLAQHQADLTEKKRQFDLEHGPASPEEIKAANSLLGTVGVSIPEGLPMSRSLLRQAISSSMWLGRGDAQTEFDPKTMEILSEGRIPQSRAIQGTGTPGITTPAGTPFPAELGGPDMGGPESEAGTLQQPITSPSTNPRMSQSIRSGSFPSMLLRRQQEQKAAAEAADKAAMDAAIGEADKAVLGGMDEMTAFRKYGLVRWKKPQDYTGPTSPEKPPSLHFGPEGEIVQPTPGEGTGFKVLRPGQPNEKKDVDLEIAKMRRDNMRAVQNAGNIVEAIRAGQDVPVKEVRLHLSTLRPIRTQYKKEADDLIGNPEEKAVLIAQVNDIDSTMNVLLKYLSGKKSGGGPTDAAPKTAEDYLRLRRNR